MSTSLTFSTALGQAEAQARRTLAPALHGRLSDAVELVTDGRVFQASDGTWQVDSTSTQGLTYAVNGTCPCDDVHFNKPPQGLCKHRLSVYLSRRAIQLMQPPTGGVSQADTTPAPEAGGPVSTSPLPVAPAPVPAPGKRGIPAHFLQHIQGRPFITYAGLVQLAHEAGLQSLTAAWTFNEGEISLAHAVAVFADGRRFEDCGDSTPQNAQRVGLHWRRLSLTRAREHSVILTSHR